METGWKRVDWFVYNRTPDISIEHTRRQLRPYGSAAKSRWPSSSSHSHAEWREGERREEESEWITLAEILKAPVSQKSITEHLESCAPRYFCVQHHQRSLSFSTRASSMRWYRCNRYTVGKLPKSASPVIYRSVDVRRNPPLFQEGWAKENNANSPAINFLSRRASGDK